jgi:hypothetical protein
MASMGWADDQIYALGADRAGQMPVVARWKACCSKSRLATTFAPHNGYADGKRPVNLGID